jgi:RNA polymerase sigma-70 factor (ECF subfamily)
MNEAVRYRNASDAELLRLIRLASPCEADGAAVELFGRYRQRVYAWCRRYVRDHERALDLAQDVLLTAWRSLDTYEGRAPFGGWLFAITHHACLRAVRKRPLARDEEADLELLPDPRPDAETMLEDMQAREELARLLRDHLDADEQRALWLRYGERMPVEEITRVLDVRTASGARGLLQTAKRKLRAARERGAAGPN